MVEGRVAERKPRQDKQHEASHPVVALRLLGVKVSRVWGHRTGMLPKDKLGAGPGLAL